MMTFLKRLKSEFRDELLFLGLQGSYRRHEETPKSDIDVVVIFENIDLPVLKRYKLIMLGMPHADKVCGFVCGKEEIMNWPKFELFQFERDTRSYLGDLFDLTEPPDIEDIIVGTAKDASALYHECIHNYLHMPPYELSESIPAEIKKAMFILYLTAYLETGVYAADKTELRDLLAYSDEDREIYELCQNYDGSATEATDAAIALINWCANLLKRYK